MGMHFYSMAGFDGKQKRERKNMCKQCRLCLQEIKRKKEEKRKTK